MSRCLILGSSSGPDAKIDPCGKGDDVIQGRREFVRDQTIFDVVSQPVNKGVDLSRGVPPTATGLSAEVDGVISY